MPNNKTPLTASNAPIIRQGLSNLSPEAPRAVMESEVHPVLTGHRR